MSKLFEEMAQGTAEARAYMEGERKGYKVTLPESIDVRGIRNRLHFSQGRFADAFGLSVDAVRHWESGRRNPEAAARALLMVIAHDPQLVMKALAQPESSIPVRARAGKGLTKNGRAKRSSAA
ncbi:putative transcriptional regulator [Granulicella aggregans]|uniref:Putative transcriptional regulator n=1 Tax=Granulicella aggregans TaxID=474949 RepID=A0A7W8E745_9BACT|nr:NadS family protein [Granulicella aggregans]MBB5061321.1 putative transcriptional regulator [Granulicella aggregans]